jgi:hypothetical protein
MENVKINYITHERPELLIRFQVTTQNLDTTNIEDALFHLGAKYGARIYNAGIDIGAIKINTETNQIDVDVLEMNLLSIKAQIFL